jgi:hypothetical protein
MKKMKPTSHGRQPKFEDDLKILIVEYLSNHWSDLAQILNLSLYDQSKVYKCMKWRWPPMEDDLNKRQPQNIDSGISQQPLIGSCSNVKLKLIWPNQSLQMLKTMMSSHGRRP